jgi:hypothetical protein
LAGRGVPTHPAYPRRHVTPTRGAVPLVGAGRRGWGPTWRRPRAFLCSLIPDPDATIRTHFSHTQRKPHMAGPTCQRTVRTRGSVPAEVGLSSIRGRARVSGPGSNFTHGRLVVPGVEKAGRLWPWPACQGRDGGWVTGSAGIRGRSVLVAASLKAAVLEILVLFDSGN